MVGCLFVLNSLEVREKLGCGEHFLIVLTKPRMVRGKQAKHNVEFIEVCTDIHGIPAVSEEQLGLCTVYVIIKCLCVQCYISPLLSHFSIGFLSSVYSILTTTYQLTGEKSERI